MFMQDIPVVSFRCDVPVVFYKLNTKYMKSFDCQLYILYLLTIYLYIQGVPGGKDLTSGECSLGQTIPI